MTSGADTGDLIATLKISGHGDHQMRGPVTIGRDPRADEGATVEVDGDPLVSKSHLCVDIDQGDLIITDLGSSNGTFLHHTAGEIAVPSDRWIPIPADAEIEFGDQRMTIERATPAVASEPDADIQTYTDPDASTIEHPVFVVQPVAPMAEAPPRSGFTDCVQCHRELPPGSKFCDGCGVPVKPATELEPEPVLAPEPVVEHADHTVAAPPGGFVSPGGFVPAGQPPPPLYGGPVPQYGQAPPGAPGTGAPAHSDGGLMFVDLSAGSSSKGGAGKKILLAIGALVLLGLIAFALVVVLGGADDSPVRDRGDTLTVPTELGELWATDVNGRSGFPGVGDAAVYVASQTETDTLITSLRREDGDENWEMTIDDADFGSLVGEFEDVAVVSACAFDVETVCSAIGLDIDDGGELWRESLGDGFAFSSAGRLLADDGEGLILLDPATGDRIERVRGEVEFRDFNARLLDDGGAVSAYDDDLRPLIGPVEVDADADAVTFDGERFVVGIGDEIEYVDAEGDVVLGPFLDGDITRLVSIDSSTLVAELGDEVVVYDVAGDDAVERWSQDGTINQVADPDGGAVVVIDAGAQLLIVDLVSGEERFIVDGEVGSISTLAASNAFAIVDRGDIENFEGEATVTAYEWTTGEEIWSEDIEGIVRVDEVVVVVETDGDVIVLG